MRVADRWIGRLPAWAAAALGAVLVAAGAVLTLRPFASVEVLVVSVGVISLGTGAGVLLGGPDRRDGRDRQTGRDHQTGRGRWHGRGRWVLGVGWLALGIAVLAWPSLTVAMLAVLVGCGLVAAGVRDLIQARTETPRSAQVAQLLAGATSLVMGVLAASWPDVTVFVVAVLFGARTALFGVGLIAGAIRRSPDPGDSPDAGEPDAPDPDAPDPDAPDAPDADDAPDAGDVGDPRPRRRRRGVLAVAGRCTGLAVAVSLLVLSVALHRQTRAAPAFYDWAGTIPAAGQLLRVEPFTHAVPAEASGWLILYSSTTSTGAPAVGSAIVLLPTDPPAAATRDDGIPVVAWDHGTTGIARTCAPSLSPDPFGDVPMIADAVQRGWAVVAPDYVGMGTAGPSPYLVGTGEGYSTLDAVLAAHQLPSRIPGTTTLSADTIIWGHSQGGHAALWTGILAPAYAPSLRIDGVAAISPATDVTAMASAVQGQLGGSLAAAYVLAAYAATYPDVRLDDYIRPGARTNITEAAKRCTSDAAGLLASILTSLPSSQSVFSRDPTSGPAGRRLNQNTPTDPIAAPLLVAQGTADEVIPISITRTWVAQRCVAGQHLDFRTYDDATHMSVLATTSPMTRQILDWTTARLDGEPAATTC